MVLNISIPNDLLRYWNKWLIFRYMQAWSIQVYSTRDLHEVILYLHCRYSVYILGKQTNSLRCHVHFRKTARDGSVYISVRLFGMVLWYLMSTNTYEISLLIARETSLRKTAKHWRCGRSIFSSNLLKSGFGGTPVSLVIDWISCKRKDPASNPLLKYWTI